MLYYSVVAMVWQMHGHMLAEIQHVSLILNPLKLIPSFSVVVRMAQLAILELT